MAQSDTCAFKMLCCFGGPGCDGEAGKSCKQAEKIVAASTQACPAISSGGEVSSKCDIPKYRALVKDGCRCGAPGLCIVRVALQGLIPVQDFEVSDHVPRDYEGKRHDPIQLKERLRPYETV